MTWWVLWAWFAFPWTFGGMPMTPGWFGWHAYPTMAECREAQGAAQPPWPIMGLTCLEAGEEPPGRLAGWQR